MTTARVGSINLIADARGDGTAALVQSMYAVVDFTPDHRHMVKADALAAVADFAHTVTIHAGSLFALADAAIVNTAQAANIYLLADFRTDKATIASIYAVCDAERPKFAQAGSISAVVESRSQAPTALASEILAVANARSATPPALVSTMQSVVLFQIQPTIQAGAVYAIADMTYTPQVQAGRLVAVANAFADHRARVHSVYAVIDATLAGLPYEYRNNRMRHGKRSKIGAISPYNEGTE